MSRTLGRAIFSLVIAVGLAACASSSYRREEPKMAAKTIEEVLREHSRELMSLPGVVGTAQGLCAERPCIKVYVIRKSAELGRKIPDIIEGYPVAVEETGEIRTFPER